MANQNFVAWLTDTGVNVAPFEVVDARNRYLNKLVQPATFADTNYNQTWLMDCDTALLTDEPITLVKNAAAKVVDMERPAIETVQRVFVAAGMSLSSEVPTSLKRDGAANITDQNNCNGGFYIIRPAFCDTLGPLWMKWAKWGLENATLFGPSAMHVDQISFALAMRKLGETVQPLGLE